MRRCGRPPGLLQVSASLLSPGSCQWKTGGVQKPVLQGSREGANGVPAGGRHPVLAFVSYFMGNSRPGVCLHLRGRRLGWTQESRGSLCLTAMSFCREQALLLATAA